MTKAIFCNLLAAFFSPALGEPSGGNEHLLRALPDLLLALLCVAALLEDMVVILHRAKGKYLP